jgi:SAM-dependent methyltransferase
LTEVPENVEVRKLDIREQDVETERYDLVHCRALLMHLPDPAAVLARMVGALRPGGLLLAEEGDLGLSLFLHAAAAMEAKPFRCAVVEDTASGITAAVSAGMRALGYVADSDEAALRQAGAEVLRSFDELPLLLGLG